MILSDFHVHPDFSVDAVGTIEEYCRRALQLGLRAICFTTHYDYNPLRDKSSGTWKYNGTRVELTDDIVAAYLEDIDKAGNRFGNDGLSIYRGIEIDYTPGADGEAQRLRSKFEFDFVIGSVHIVNGYAISENDEAEEYFKRRSVEQMCEEYFPLLESAAGCESFDALGHLDYYARYARRFYGEKIDRLNPEKFDPVFEILKTNGTGIEINTSPCKRGEAGFHPAQRILDRAIDAGVRISSVGSDCHNPDHLGIGVKEAFQFLESRSITPVFPL
jgi:histidinol-phosphatase (PHP family)